MNLPKPEGLIKGRLYRLESRNLRLGVWDGEKAFIGIRNKFGCEFLDDENHWNIDHGTVEGAEDMGFDAPTIEANAGRVGQRHGAGRVGQRQDLKRSQEHKCLVRMTHPKENGSKLQ